MYIVVSFDQSNNVYDRWVAAAPSIRSINPAITYRPWSNGDGSLMAAIPPSCAYPIIRYPMNTTISPSPACRNLTVKFGKSILAKFQNGTLEELAANECLSSESRF